MAPRLFAVCIASIPFVSACAFVLDFDELQRGNAATTKDGGGGRGNDAGGTAGKSTDSGAEAGADSGSDASQVCEAGCADNDPCTVDACGASGCTHTYTPGVALDGLSDVARAKTFHRVTLTGWKNTFYLSALKATTTSTEVLLHSFDEKTKSIGAGIDLTTLANFNGLVPVSAAGIAAASQSIALKLFVAMGQTLESPAQVWEVTVDPTLGVTSAPAPAALDSNYAAAPTVYPIAWALSDTDIGAAWPGVTAGVFLHHAGTAPEAAGANPRFGPLGGKVSMLAPLLAGSDPGVLYVNAQPRVEAVGQLLPSTLGSCYAGTASYTSVVSAPVELEGIWLAGWTRTLTDGTTLQEFKPIVCGGTSGNRGCAGSSKCESTDQSYPGVRNAAVVFFTRPADSAGRVFEAMATPYVKGKEVGIDLQAIQIDFNLSNLDAGQKTKSVTTDPISIVKSTAGPNNAGPDWPAMAFLPPDHLGIAWIAPGDASGQELHVERRKICFPK